LALVLTGAPLGQYEKGRSRKMKKRAATITAGMFTVALSLLPTTARTASTDEEQIRRVYEQLISGCNAKDVNAIMKAYVEDESLLVFDALPPRQYVGAKAYRKDWEEFLAFFKGSVKCEFSELSVVADSMLGYGHTIFHTTGTDAKDKAVDLTMRVTDVYRKIDGTWKIVHEHISFPVDLDTGKPDFSSKP
jgi:ketosteroid isomerase-like protein